MNNGERILRAKGKGVRKSDCGLVINLNYSFIRLQAGKTKITADHVDADLCCNSLQ